MSYTLLNIDLADLTAIKITCGQCHASAEFPVARLQSDSPERCFHCRAMWFAAKSPQATALEHLLRVIMEAGAANREHLFRALGELRGDAVQECRVHFVIDPGLPRTKVPY